MNNLDKVFSSDNILVTASDKKRKKGGGINEILRLMGELLDFQEKIEACSEAQDLSENKQKLDELNDKLSEGYQGLVDVVSGGMRSRNGDEEIEVNEEIEIEIEDVDGHEPDPIDLKPVSKPITMVNAPSIPRF